MSVAVCGLVWFFGEALGERMEEERERGRMKKIVNCEGEDCVIVSERRAFKPKAASTRKEPTETAERGQKTAMIR